MSDNDKLKKSDDKLEEVKFWKDVENFWNPVKCPSNKTDPLTPYDLEIKRLAKLYCDRLKEEWELYEKNQLFPYVDNLSEENSDNESD